MVNRGSPVPDPWASAPRYAVDSDLLADPTRLSPLLDTLQRRYVERVPFVVELDPSARLDLRQVTRLPPYELGGEFTFLHERLVKAMWHNSYDGRSGDLKWWWSDKAADSVAVTRGGPADVLLADSTPAWIDGGPRQPLQLDHPVIHHETIELGRVTTVPLGADPSADLAPDQRLAVGHQVGPARIIAPAGSGKTRVLVARLRHVIEDRGIEPELVTALAYNNRAAAEMRSRLPSEWSKRVRTIHSLGLAIVRDSRTGVEVIGEMEVRERLKALAPAPPRTNTDVIAPYLDALSDVQVGLVDPAEVEEMTDDVPGFAAVFEKYRNRLLQDRRIDYGEMIYGAIEALCLDPELRHKWQRKCRHLLVDEFQDLTPGYLLLIRLLASPGLNVFGVGDDDQVIYGYQGADPGFLIGFEKLFPGATAHALEVNYRCPQDVVESSVKLLSHNQRRVAKKIRPASTDQGLQVLTRSSTALAETMVQRIRELVAQGAPTADIAVLARVNSALLPVHVALALHDIPFRSDLGPEMLNRTLLRATFAWWRMALDPERVSRDDLYESIRRPARGLVGAMSAAIGEKRGPFSLDDLVELGAGLEERHVDKWGIFCDDIVAASAAATATANLLDCLLNVVGLKGSAEALDSGRSRVGTSHHGDDLTALLRIADLCPSPSEFEAWLRRLLATPSRDGGILLSSVHRVKGLEWDHVFVFGADRDITPHRLSGDIEEERRVFHVAVTRGIRTVTIVADEKRPSPFLDELRRKSVPKPASVVKPATRPTTRAAAPRRNTVIVRPGDLVRAAGGYWGRVAAIHEKGVTLELETGTTLEVEWGEQVRRGKEAGFLTPEGGVGGVSPNDAPSDGVNLTEKLRRWRLDKAKELGVPAFVIFNDRTLDELAGHRPSDESGLLAVYGIGTAKLESFGDDLLALLADP